MGERLFNKPRYYGVSVLNYIEANLSLQGLHSIGHAGGHWKWKKVVVAEMRVDVWEKKSSCEMV